jgi:hypothetical protein
MAEVFPIFLTRGRPYVVQHKPSFQSESNVPADLNWLNATVCTSGATPRSVSRWTNAKTMPRRDAEDRLLELKVGEYQQVIGAVLAMAEGVTA